MGRTAPLPLRRIPGVKTGSVRVAVNFVTNPLCSLSASVAGLGCTVSVHLGVEAVGVGLVSPSYAP